MDRKECLDWNKTKDRKECLDWNKTKKGMS
jgi:hypothetical protein